MGNDNAILFVKKDVTITLIFNSLYKDPINSSLDLYQF